MNADGRAAYHARFRKVLEYIDAHADENLQVDGLPLPPDNEYHVDLCASIERSVADNPFGVVEKTIPAGRCAVLRHIGSDDTLSDSVTYLYSTWLPGSGEELRDFPLYFQRVSFFPDVPEHEAITDVFLPLRAVN